MLCPSSCVTVWPGTQLHATTEKPRFAWVGLPPPCFESPVDQGKWDEVHEWRDELKADLVCLF
ncbi:MAG: hypothetical protein ACKOFI_03550, partial [Phycisphaerales bacterium]